jgi:hypothetical protein
VLSPAEGHLDDKSLISLLFGDLPEHERAAIETHLEQCDECAKLYKVYAEIFEILAIDMKVELYDIEKVKKNVLGTYERLYLYRAPFEVKVGEYVLRFLRVGPGLRFFENILLSQEYTFELQTGVRDGAAEPDFETEEGRAVVEMLDGEGRAAPGVELTITGPETITVMTDDRGRAELQGLPEGGYEVKVKS